MHFLLSKGYNIELIRRSNIPGEHRADVLVDGIVREIKAPKGNSAWTMSRNLKHGKRQSNRIIVDLFRCARAETKAIRETLNMYYKTKEIYELWIITKHHDLLKYEK